MTSSRISIDQADSVEHRNQGKRISLKIKKNVSFQIVSLPAFQSSHIITLISNFFVQYYTGFPHIRYDVFIKGSVIKFVSPLASLTYV